MIDELLYFIKERHSIYVKKEAGLPKPWTKDVILQTYKFCNVYRELDTVTKWIIRNIRGPYSTNPNLWFMLVISRLINWPDSLEELDFTKPWDPSKFLKILGRRKTKGEKVFSGAYIVSTNGRKQDKLEYLAEHVLSPLWKERKNLLPGTSLQEYHERLIKFNGLGSFLAAQVIADLKYTPQLRNAPDWWTWAASGPGSRRGLNRVLGRGEDFPWNEKEWLGELQYLQEKICRSIKEFGMSDLHNQDLQNCLCEFDKYQRVKLGEGRPRSLYPGKGLHETA